MTQKDTKDFDWLDDPFDDKKMAEAYTRAQTSINTKIALGCVCVLVMIAAVVLLLLAGVNVLEVLV